jgi:esterase/lipase
VKIILAFLVSGFVTTSGSAAVFEALPVSVGNLATRRESPVASVAGIPVQAAGSDAGYASAVASFQQYIASKKVRDPGDLPFLLIHGGKTSRAVLMAHGLTDSPYYMRALADILFAAGYNVACVLLPGHGTRPEDLKTVRLQQWKDEVKFGLGVVRELGESVSLAGFSTGAALDLDVVAANYKSPDPIPLKDLLFFSPAIKIADHEAELACLPGVREVMELTHPWAAGDAATPETNPYKYAKMALNSVCELDEMIHQNSSHDSTIMKDIHDHGIGVFTVESAADQTIDPESVVKFMNGLPQGTREDFILYPKDAAIPHGSVTRPETNPFYAQLAQKLSLFIAEPAAAAAGASISLQPLGSGAFDQLSSGNPF